MKVKLVIVTKLAGMHDAVLDRVASIARMTIQACSVRRMEDVVVLTCRVADPNEALQKANALVHSVPSITGMVLDIGNARKPAKIGVF